MKKISFLLTAVLFLWSGNASSKSAMTPAARRLFDVIDALNVEQNWPAGKHVNWETGIPDGGREFGHAKHTHCSVFVAAAAKRLGIYILRPPNHGQILLANAQYDWLASEGLKQGWQPLANGMEAQSFADQGDFVVAVYKNHHENSPGHIAIVRPGDESLAEIKADGPQVTQAGLHNYHSTSLKQGFAGHPHAFKNDEIKFYAHRVAAFRR